MLDCGNSLTVVRNNSQHRTGLRRLRCVAVITFARPRGACAETPARVGPETIQVSAYPAIRQVLRPTLRGSRRRGRMQLRRCAAGGLKARPLRCWCRRASTGVHGPMPRGVGGGGGGGGGRGGVRGAGGDASSVMQAFETWCRSARQAGRLLTELTLLHHVAALPGGLGSSARKAAASSGTGRSLTSSSTCMYSIST